jgi:hypothetical protein
MKKMKKSKKASLFIACLLLVWGFNGIGSASIEGQHYYYVPHVAGNSEFYPANDSYTDLFILITEDGTDYEVDQEGDGIYENQFNGVSAGVIDYYQHNSNPRYGGPLATGASIRSNKPLQVTFTFNQNDYSTYDAGFMSASIIPKEAWGSNFVVPVNSTYFYIFSDSPTQVKITPPGQSTSTYTISARKNIKFSNISSGTTITADDPVYVLAVNCQPDQNYPWMYNVLPIEKIGLEYYHDTTYGEYDTWPTIPKIWITAVNDGTIVNIDENKDGTNEYTYYLNANTSAIYSNPKKGAHIWANEKMYVVYVENWNQSFHGKFGGGATEYLPTASYGNNYALCEIGGSGYLADNQRIFIVANGDNTTVKIDFNWDGVDLTKKLDKGEVWAVFWPKFSTPYVLASSHIWSDSGIQVIYRTDLAHPDHPGVVFAYTAVPLIKPNDSPVALCDDISISVDQYCQAFINPGDIDGGSYDPDGDNIELTVDNPGPFSIGEHIVILTVTDEHGKSDTCQATVTVIDSIDPVPDLAILLTVSGECWAEITVIPTATDNCAGQINGVTNDPLKYTTQGTFTVTWIYNDGNGNIVTQTQTVVVQDLTAPNIENIKANPSILWPPNHKMVPINVDVTAIDNCDPNLDCRIINVASNEPVNGLGDGDTSPDWEITGLLSVNLRAERSGTGTGRIYTITVLCKDASGNSSTRCIDVLVPHNKN